MINKFSIAKALRDQAATIATINSFTLVGNGEGFTPDVNQTYIQEITLYGDDNTIGVADDSSDIQIGVYQMSVYTPKSEDGAKWAGLQIINIFQIGFPKGLELTFDNQTVRVRNASLSSMMQDDTHLIHHLSIVFSVIN